MIGNMAYSLIANSGIYITSFPLEIKLREKFNLWFHEWYNTYINNYLFSLVHPGISSVGKSRIVKTQLYSIILFTD